MLLSHGLTGAGHPAAVRLHLSPAESADTATPGKGGGLNMGRFILALQDYLSRSVTV